ncbi:MAG TPA: hypothetical protein VKV06_03115, partial [Acidimicrobiales bacterium]|nr:hypothetical protein [Acidimicrobiales bacterium]
MRIPYPGLPAVRSPDRGYQRHVRWRDRTVDLLLRGYPTLGELRRRGGKEAGVVVPLLGRPSLCVGGPAGVRLFYDETLTTRQGALPAPVRSVLFGDGAVHGLDGAAHRERKGMFLSLLGEPQARELAAVADRRWAEAIAGWVGRDAPVSVFDQSVEVLGAAVCEWAGVPGDRSGPQRYRDLAAIVDGFGSVGPRHLAARRARRRADRWAAGIVDDVRAGRITPPEGSALAVIAGW